MIFAILFLFLLLAIIIITIILASIRKRPIPDGECTFYHCQKYNPGKLLSKKLSETCHKINTDNAQLYIPCGYTWVETELQSHDPVSGQIVFAIDGCDKIVSKNGLWDILERYYGRSGAAQLVPESWTDLSNSIPDSGTFMLKKNIQRQQGLKLTRSRNDVQNANKDGYVVVQRYIENPLLFDGRKFDIRVYMLIVKIHDNLSFYRHSGGRCHYTNRRFSMDTLDRKVHIPSGYVEDTEFKRMHPETCKDLQQYLQQRGISFFAILDQLLTQCSRAFFQELCNNSKYKQNTQCQLFGLDILLDENYKPWLIEINKGPEMDWSSVIEKEYKQQIIDEMFKLLEGRNDHEYVLLFQSKK